MPNSIICTQDDLDQGIVCLTRGQSIGLAVIVEASLISAIALVGVFVWIFIRAYGRKKLVQRPMDLFLLALFFFDIIMALGSITNIKWIRDGKIFDGSYCTAQGTLQQFGETGSAMVTTMIAIYTIARVMWGTFKHELLFAYLAINFIWLFLVIFIGVTVGTQTHGTQHYMTPAGFWCWIGNGSRYNAERYAGEYVWMWTALAVSVITYVPLSFVALGIRLGLNENHWWRFTLHRQGSAEGQTRRSISMIAYPVVYVILVIPISVVRWVSGFGSAEKMLPSAATLASECVFSLSGLANVFIFLFTRSDLFMVGNVETRGYRLALPPANSHRHLESNGVELAVPRSGHQLISSAVAAARRARSL